MEESIRMSKYGEILVDMDGWIHVLADNLRKYCAWRRKYHSSGWEMQKIWVERILLGVIRLQFFPSSVGGNEWKKSLRKNRKRAQFSMRMRGSYLSSILAENLFSIRSLASLIF